MASPEMAGARPLLLLDVDGVLNLTGLNGLVDPTRPGRDGTFPVPGRDWRVNISMWRSHRLYHRTDLRELFDQLASDFEVVWATSWNDEAHDMWASVLGLTAPLPHIELDTEVEMSWHNPRLCWKTEQVLAWLLHHRPGVGGVWLDDDVSRHDRPHLPTGVHPLRCDPARGLDASVVARVRELVTTLPKGTPGAILEP